MQITHKFIEVYSANQKGALNIATRRDFKELRQAHRGSAGRPGAGRPGSGGAGRLCQFADLELKLITRLKIFKLDSNSTLTK